MADNSREFKIKKRGSNRRLPVWALVLIDVLSVCIALVIFAFFHHVYPRIQAQKEAGTAEYESVITAPSATPEPEKEETEIIQEEPEEEKDDWKFASLTTDEVVITDHSYSSHDIFIDIKSYESEEGVIKSPYTVADIYVRDIHCLQSYFAGAKYIDTGHGGYILDLMEESGAILASNGDYYSMQLQSGVLRNGVLYRYPASNYDVFILYEDGSVRIVKSKTIKTREDWDAAFENAWQAWSFGPSLLDENGVQYENLRANIFAVMANGNPRTGLGYYEPGHYCIVVVDGRADGAPGATIEEFASVFESLGCAQAYNLDGGGSSVMAFNGEIISSPSQNRKLPDIILVTEYEGSFAQKEALSREESNDD